MIKLFVTETCHECSLVKEELKKKKVVYKLMMIQGMRGEEYEEAQKLGLVIVPALVIEGQETIYGAEEILKYFGGKNV